MNQANFKTSGHDLALITKNLQSQVQLPLQLALKGDVNSVLCRQSGNYKDQCSFGQSQLTHHSQSANQR
jgi:hypothetical protein